MVGGQQVEEAWAKQIPSLRLVTRTFLPLSAKISSILAPLAEMSPYTKAKRISLPHLMSLHINIAVQPSASQTEKIQPFFHMGAHYTSAES